MNTDITYHFNGKVALVTGAAFGIGLATPKLFAKAGATVVMAGSSMDCIIRAHRCSSAVRITEVPITRMSQLDHRHHYRCEQPGKGPIRCCVPYYHLLCMRQHEAVAYQGGFRRNAHHVSGEW